MDWKFVVYFSTNVENLKKLDRSKILMCDYHPQVPGDAYVAMVFDTMVECTQVRFKGYAESKDLCDENKGGLHIYSVKDPNEHKGQNLIDEIIQEYNV